MIETVLLFILCVAVACLSFMLGRWKGSDDRQLLEADLNGQRLARKEQERRYDKLYDAFLRVNKLNTELNKKVQNIPPTYEDVADDMYTMLNMGFSRQGIAKKYNIPYTTVCFWLRKKSKEMENKTVETADFHQNYLI